MRGKGILLVITDQSLLESPLELLTGFINGKLYDHLNQQNLQRNRKVVDENLEEQKISS